MNRTILGLIAIPALLVGIMVAVPRDAVVVARETTPPPQQDYANTFSIVAYDPDKGEWGVAVASKYLAVGSAVPWAKAGVGAVATQSLVNVTYGPRGLELLAEGKSAEEVVKLLTEADKGKDSR